MLARFVTDVLYPDPDNPGSPNWHWPGPGPGPQVHDLWVMLNPQPIPPGRGELVAEPSDPSPWRAAFEASRIVERAVMRLQFASVLENPKQMEKLHGLTRLELSEFVDDFCGTGKKPKPPKPPNPWSLLGAGVQLLSGAEQVKESLLRSEFENPADRLLQTALKD